MRTHTLKLSEQSNLMMSVRLSRNGMAVEYSLTEQSGKPVVGPCQSEQELESLSYRLINIAQQKRALSDLAYAARLEMLLCQQS